MTEASKTLPRRNIYMCPDCGHGFISEDADEGVTPFMTKCLNCGKSAQSFFYRAPMEMLAQFKPAIVWYRPPEPALATMSPATQEHVRKGGLISRKAD